MATVPLLFLPGVNICLPFDRQLFVRDEGAEEVHERVAWGHSRRFRHIVVRVAHPVGVEALSVNLSDSAVLVENSLVLLSVKHDSERPPIAEPFCVE